MWTRLAGIGDADISKSFIGLSCYMGVGMVWYGMLRGFALHLTKRVHDSIEQAIEFRDVLYIFCH